MKYSKGVLLSFFCVFFSFLYYPICVFIFIYIWYNKVIRFIFRVMLIDEVEDDSDVGVEEGFLTLKIIAKHNDTFTDDTSSHTIHMPTVDNGT